MAMAAMLLVAVLAILTTAQGLRFELSPSGTKCVSENIPTNTLVLGDYHIVSTDLPQESNPKINARVTTPYGSTVHFVESTDKGHFAFTSAEAGNYMACFWMTSAPSNAPANIELDWKTGYAAKDWDSIAKKDKLEGLELELRRLDDVVESIHDQMLYLREREITARNLSEGTNAKVAWLSIWTLFLCALLSAAQLFYLQSYFQRKKLL